MLKIRLSRFGTSKRPTYRLSVTEKAKDTLGRVLEYLGSYNPRSNPPLIQLNVERIKYWLSKGAQASPTVHNLLVSQGVVEGKKVKAWTPKKSAQGGSGSAGKEEEKKPSEAGSAPAGEAAAPAAAESEKSAEAKAEEQPVEEPKA
jgi:small subunit ribosomal protein S16